MCSMIGTALIVVVIVLCSLLVFPGVFGFHTYNVLTGSMEPAIKVGSLIYVKDGDPEEVVEDDIIAFYGSLEDSGIITHRVVKVVLTVPYVGEALVVMTSFYGKIAAACVILLGAALNLIGGRMRDKAEERE